MLAHGRLRQLLLVLGFLVPLTGGAASSAPIAFKFEALIGPPRANLGTLDLPFQFAEGDIVTGQFTFDPNDGVLPGAISIIQQPHPVQLQVQGFPLEMTNFEVLVMDNLTTDESPEIEDVIVFRRAAPEFVGDSTRYYWLMGATFSGDQNVFVGADMPPDIESWRELLPASLTVTFTDTLTGNGAGFKATITSLTQVPEPSARTMTILAFLITAGWFVRNSYSLAQRRQVV